MAGVGGLGPCSGGVPGRAGLGGWWGNTFGGGGAVGAGAFSGALRFTNVAGDLERW